MVQVGPQWSQWILKWPQTVPESPRQSFKFQKSSQVLPFSYQLFISTARCSRRSSVLNLSDKPPSPYRSSVCECRHFKHFGETEQLDPSWAKMTQVDPRWLKVTQVELTQNDASWPKLNLSWPYPDCIQTFPDRILTTSRSYPDCIQTRPI